MSIQAIKEAFQNMSGPIRCTAARMRYTDDRMAQVLEFDIVQDGKQRTIISDPIPHREPLTVHAAKIAAQLRD